MQPAEPMPQNSAPTNPHHALLVAFPIAAYTCDVNGLITDFNEGARVLWGRTPRLNDMADRWCGSYGLRSLTDGSSIPHDDCCIAVAIRTGTPQRDEVIVERPDGSQITISCQVDLIRDANHNVIGAVSALIDLTEHNAAELAQRYLGAIVSSSDDAIISKTLEGKIVSWNRAAERLFKHTAEEVIGKPVTVIIPEERHGEERDILAKLVRGERIDHYETVRVTKTGELLDVSLTSSPIRDSRGRIVGASKIARDITLQKRHEAHLKLLHEELHQADIAKNNFLATLAHELRNPLAPIRTMIHLLKEQSPDVVDLPQAVAMIDRQITQMTRLVDDLMDVSRISKNKFELRREAMDFSSAVHSAIEWCHALLESKGQHFSVDLPAEPIHLVGDPTRLTQAIGNLINNAAKYTDAGGTIALRVSVQGNTVTLTVSDNGVGIEPAMIDRVFEMFVQAESRKERRDGGLGVGLHLARRLAEMHGGTLSASSGGIGKGSEFVLALPLDQPASVQAVQTSDGVQATTSTGKRIIVVDDNRDAADSLSLLLRALGHEATAMYDGLQLLSEGAAVRPDVVVLDIGLPEIDGYETARRLRATEWGQSVRLCALTGWGQEDARRKSREAGFDAHFVKPVDVTVLGGALA